MDYGSTGQPPVRRVTLGGQIADALRGDILFGRLPAGTPLRQQELCERFGTSRMPVRDALRQLMYQGFLTRGKGRVPVVVALRRQDLTDVFHVQGLLHGLAVRRVAEQAAAATLAELRERHEQMLRTEAEADLRRLAQLDREFHRCFNDHAASPKLMAALQTLRLRVPPEYVVALPDWTRRVNREHTAILEAVLDGDAPGAEVLMRSHIGEAGERLVRAFQQRGLELL